MCQRVRADSTNTVSREHRVDTSPATLRRAEARTEAGTFAPSGGLLGTPDNMIRLATKGAKVNVSTGLCAMKQRPLATLGRQWVCGSITCLRAKGSPQP